MPPPPLSHDLTADTALAAWRGAVQLCDPSVGKEQGSKSAERERKISFFIILLDQPG